MEEAQGAESTRRLSDMDERLWSTAKSGDPSPAELLREECKEFAPSETPTDIDSSSDEDGIAASYTDETPSNLYQPSARGDGATTKRKRLQSSVASSGGKLSWQSQDLSSSDESDNERKRSPPKRGEAVHAPKVLKSSNTKIQINTRAWAAMFLDERRGGGESSDSFSSGSNGDDYESDEENSELEDEEEEEEEEEEVSDEGEGGSEEGEETEGSDSEVSDEEEEGGEEEEEEDAGGSDSGTEGSGGTGEDEDELPTRGRKGKNKRVIASDEEE